MNDPQANRGLAAALAAGVLIGLVAFQVIGSLVNDLLAPLIAVFIGGSRFELNSFVIEASEFRYGQFLEAVLIAAISGIALIWLFSSRGRRYWQRLGQRDGAGGEDV
jgi:large conductance mechanosensitive channel